MIKDIVYKIFMFKYWFPFMQTTLFDSDQLDNQGWRPFLTFLLIRKTRQKNNTIIILDLQVEMEKL